MKKREVVVLREEIATCRNCLRKFLRKVTTAGGRPNKYCSAECRRQIHVLVQQSYEQRKHQVS